MASDVARSRPPDVVVHEDREADPERAAAPEAPREPQHCSLSVGSPSSVPPTPSDLEGSYAFEAFAAAQLAAAKGSPSANHLNAGAEIHPMTSRGAPSTARESAGNAHRP